MKLGFVVVFLLIIGCTNTENKTYVKTQEIQLSQPRVSATNTIIDSSVVVTADLEMKGVRIFYTNNGTEPTQESSLYTKPLTTQEQGIYKFKAFHSDWKPSETLSLILFKKGIVPDKIDWITNAHPNYPDEDLRGLINQKKGSLNFRDLEWTGFDSITKVTVYFKNKTYIHSLTIGYLIDIKSWIFPPEEVSIYLDEDPLRFTFEETIIYNKPPNSKELSSSSLLLEKEIKSITIVMKNFQKIPDWHPGKGNKAWLFLDEFIFTE